MLTLADIVEALTGERPEGPGRVVTEAVIDSRHAIPGSLFVALPGERVDGHTYVGSAFERGAHLAFVQHDLPEQYPTLDLRPGAERPPQDLANMLAGDQPVLVRVENCLDALQKVAGFWRRTLDVRVIGVTGSVGKSTTKELIAEVLNRRYRTLKNSGNLNNEIGLPLTLLRLTEGHQRAVLEMGFYVPGEIKFLCDLALPAVGVLTNIGTVHAERAGSQEVIARGKAELVEALPPAPEGVAILNYDDPWVRGMAEKTQAQVFFYGLNPKADLWADGVAGMGLDGIRFRLHFRNEMIHLRVPLLGQHSVHTALRAAAVGLVEGLTWQEIVHGLRSEHTQLRLVAVRTESGALVLDDTYNASPESTLAALNLLDEMEGRKVAVLGGMLELGQYEARGHAMVGVRVAEVADELVTVGELGGLIAVSARAAGMKPDRVVETVDAAAAVVVLKERLQPDDVVLVKGSREFRLDRIVSALEAH